MVDAVENFLSQAGPWSLVVIFIVIALESSALLGLVFPGEMVAVIAGAMASDAFFSPWTAFAVVATSAIVGDLTGYTLGHTKGQAVLTQWAFARRQYEKHRERLEYYFEHFGGLTVFVGRFVAVGRAFVPFTAGLSGMRIRKFAPMSFLAGLVWASVTVGLGYPVADRLRRRFELLRQFLRRATGPNQLDHLPAELRRIRWVLVCHCGLRKLKRSGVHETGATSGSARWARAFHAVAGSPAINASTM